PRAGYCVGFALPNSSGILAMSAAMRRAFIAGEEGSAPGFADSLVAGEHLFRNVPTFGRLGVFARALGRVPWRVAIMPDGPSYRMGARRAAAVTSVATPQHQPVL